MSKEILDQLDKRYVLDMQLYTLNEQRNHLEESVRQATWELRCRKQDLVEYESGLRQFLDRLRGKQAETTEAFKREIRKAQENLAALSREQDRTTLNIGLLLQQSENLPTAEALRDAAAENPETAEHWAKLERQLCARMLRPLLEENEKALQEYRDLLRGTKMGEITTYEQHHEIGTAHIGLGRQCAALLERMGLAAQKLGETWELPGYFRNPEGFIEFAAARHNRLDRVNMALDQLYALKKRITGILNAE